MSFDWQKFLFLAEYMNVHADDFPDAEACYRSSVSRAYYAAFCLCRNYVREREGKQFYGDDHQKLQDYLKKNPHRTGPTELRVTLMYFLTVSTRGLTAVD